jgi:hypothetical protein
MGHYANECDEEETIKTSNKKDLTAWYLKRQIQKQLR